MTLDWIPRERIGTYVFDASVEPYINNGTLRREPFEAGVEDIPGLDRYVCPSDDGLEIYARDGRIDTVTCYRRCVLRGINLIGLDYGMVRDVIGFEPTDGPDVLEVFDEIKYMYDFAHVGATVWIQNGNVESIDCDSRK